MKQEITEKQWEELTDDQELKFANTVWVKNGEKTCKLHPPNVGEMIEFLQEKGKYRWWGTYVFDSNQDTASPDYEGEFCDALWEACREVLEGV